MSVPLLAELQRINSHLVWLGTHGMELGAVSVLMYCFRERELLLNINEMLAGFRMFPSYMRVGGLREDLPRGFHAAVRAFLDAFPAKLDEYICHRLEREQRLIAALGAGKRTAGELLDDAWSDALVALRPAAAATLAAHLDKLAEEGRLPEGVERPEFSLSAPPGACGQAPSPR